MALPVKLPNFGLPRSYGHEDGFPHALDDEGRGKMSQGVTLRERRMLQFMDSITDKPEWERKVHDDAIVAKWRAETEEVPPIDGDVYMSKVMFDNCLAELRDKAVRFATTGFVTTLDAEIAVVKADTVVPADLVADLRAGVAVLENVPEKDKDWHPGSDGLVLDLLHPSLFPVIYGRTRALRTGRVPIDGAVALTGQGETTALHEGAFELEGDEDRFQWLPTDVILSGGDDESSKSSSRLTAHITGYINNLHPAHHRPLYGVLERFVAAAVPLWEECLSWGDVERRRLVIKKTEDDEDFFLPDGVPPYKIPEKFMTADGTIDEDYKYEEDYDNYKEKYRVLRFPEPDHFQPFSERLDIRTRLDLHKRFPDGLQVIFKLANIHLTPEKPVYNGGTWHVEGTLAERICATALYYYDEANITESRLSFRQSVDEENFIMIPQQYQYQSLLRYFGIEQDDVAIQKLGSVVTREGRLLAFPNVLQHRVGKFRLQDPLKPGHRKILAMFLVDPHRRILSTSNVPPQQREWWADHVHGGPPDANPSHEISNESTEDVESYPISIDEAVELRAELMASRGAVAEYHNETLYEHTFSFCEH